MIAIKADLGWDFKGTDVFNFRSISSGGFGRRVEEIAEPEVINVELPPEVVDQDLESRILETFGGDTIDGIAHSEYHDRPINPSQYMVFFEDQGISPISQAGIYSFEVYRFQSGIQPVLVITNDGIYEFNSDYEGTSTEPTTEYNHEIIYQDSNYGINSPISFFDQSVQEYSMVIEATDNYRQNSDTEYSKSFDPIAENKTTNLIETKFDSIIYTTVENPIDLHAQPIQYNELASIDNTQEPIPFIEIKLDEIYRAEDAAETFDFISNHTSTPYVKEPIETNNIEFTENIDPNLEQILYVNKSSQNNQFDPLSKKSYQLTIRKSSAQKTYQIEINLDDIINIPDLDSQNLPNIELAELSDLIDTDFSNVSYLPEIPGTFDLPVLVPYQDEKIKKKNEIEVPQEIIDLVKEYEQKLGATIRIAYTNLRTGETYRENDNEDEGTCLNKVAIMLEAFRQIKDGKLTGETKIKYDLAENAYDNVERIIHQYRNGKNEFSVNELLNEMMRNSSSPAASLLFNKLTAKNINQTTKRIGVDDMKTVAPYMQGEEYKKNTTSASAMNQLLTFIYSNEWGEYNKDMQKLMEQDPLNYKTNPPSYMNSPFFKQGIIIGKKMGLDPSNMSETAMFKFDSDPIVLTAMINGSKLPFTINYGGTDQYKMGLEFFGKLSKLVHRLEQSLYTPSLSK